MAQQDSERAKYVVEKARQEKVILGFLGSFVIVACVRVKVCERARALVGVEY